MIQLYCPACENVVLFDGDEPEDVVPCPSCEQPIYWVSRRKARPVTEIDSRLVVAATRKPVPRALPVRTVVDEPASAAHGEKWAQQEEQDFSVPVSETSPLFVGLPYRPEGGLSLVRLPLYVAGVWTAAVGLGLLASFLGQICYLILLYPLALGLALAGVSVLAGHLGRVRSPVMAGLVASIGGLLTILAMHLFDYQRIMRLVETEPFALPEAMARQLWDAPGFVSYLDATAKLGLTISGRDSGGLHFGYKGTCAYWGIELLLVMGIAALGGSLGARDPFCVSCGIWKEDRFLGTLHDGDAMRRDLKRGRLTGLECFRPSEFTGGELVLTVSVCPRCGTACPLDVRLDRNPRSRQEPNLAELPLRLTLPGAALPVLEQVFRPGA